ncbi:MAG: hypothetical protein SNJ75_12155 [Gemmataceae bacterium]
MITTTPPRTVRYHADRRVMTINLAGKATEYRVTEHDVCEGRAFRLTRPNGESYDVFLGHNEDSCTCADAVFRQRQCKHHAALVALLKSKKI